jgi:co-chaperonin GroES (HSP10)
MFNPIKTGIFFMFIEEVNNGRFMNSTSNGLIINSNDKTQLIPRWGKVIAVGPDVTDVEPDMFVLVDAGKWTEGIPFKNIKFWKTEESHVLLISDKPQYTY